MPKLTLRDLFAVVTIVALALGWLLDRSRLAAENRKLISENKELVAQQRAMLRDMAQSAQQQMADILEEYQRTLEEMGHPLGRDRGDWTALPSDQPGDSK
jgi:uncharacterized protein HemX